jgi:di/tricarboxylate transporter
MEFATGMVGVAPAYFMGELGLQLAYRFFSFFAPEPGSANFCS